MEGKFQFTITGDMSPELIDAVANKVIEITQPNFFEGQETKYTVKEVAKLAGCTTQTIGIHIRKGILKATKPGRDYKISESNLKTYLDGK